ncbi:hypothetical protein [Coxiella-like endosymbiont]|uniref:hypothetical protein n=1 Tax=Coxiella-like endosymbiont TaxID=1592897 RepID=UPI0034E1B3CA
MYKILTLVEKLNSLIVHALEDKAIIPNESPFGCGGLGILRVLAVSHPIELCDLILMLGTNFPYRIAAVLS